MVAEKLRLLVMWWEKVVVRDAKVAVVVVVLVRGLMASGVRLRAELVNSARERIVRADIRGDNTGSGRGIYIIYVQEMDTKRVGWRQ